MAAAANTDHTGYTDAMCGIAGIVRFDGRPVDPDRPRAMLDHLRHRGPDGEAIEQRGNCTLVHARLGIIDLPGGGQPMGAAATGSHGPLTVVFNGMIYNHRDLRVRLEKLGHCFVTDHSDTEVLLHGYRQWGTELPRHLEGFFAFAIRDENEQSLYLCRDRAGKKPLYIRRTGGALAFASLAGTLIEGSDTRETPEINPEALLTYLRLGYTFDASLIRGVEEVPFAHWVKFDRAGRAQQGRYWQAPAPSQPTGQADLVSLEVLLQTAVDRRLEADVPLGCFLSGGIDSSIVAALAQRTLATDGPLQTFSVRMSESDFDESAYARMVADHIASHHTQLEARPDADLIADLERLIGIMGEPTADSSLLPTFWLSRVARQHVKVALSGDGGDELFGGYDRYRAMRLLDRHGWWLRSVPAKWVVPAPNRPHAVRTRLSRLRTAAVFERPAAQYLNLMHLFTDDQIRDLGLDPHLDAPSPDMPEWPQNDDAVNAAMQWDRSHYLPYDLLRKVDRASMATALEVRCPMLDTKVVELACRLTPEALMPRGRPKGLLRQLARRLVPDAVACRPKRGFAIPVGRWFRSELRPALAGHVLDGRLGDLGLRREPLERFVQEHTSGRADHTHRLFALLSLRLWQEWLGGRHDSKMTNAQ